MRSGGFEEIDDLLNRAVRLVIGRLEFGVGAMCGVGFVMKAAVGQRSAKPFMKEEKQQSDLDTFGGEAITVAGSVALK